MAQLIYNYGKFTVVVDGLVIGHNLSRKDALKLLEDYDFD